MITKPCRNLKEILNSVCETTGSSFKTANLILLNQKPLVVYINTAKMPCCGLQNFNYYHYSLQMEEHRWRVSFKKSPTNSSTEMVTTIAAAAGFSEFQRGTLYIWDHYAWWNFLAKRLEICHVFWNKTTQIVVFEQLQICNSGCPNQCQYSYIVTNSKYKYLYVQILKAFCWTSSLRIKFFFSEEWRT